MKKLLVLFMVILLVSVGCTPAKQQQKPIEFQQQGNLDTNENLETDLSAIFDPGKVENCRITSDTADVKVGTGNKFDTIGNLQKNDVVKVLDEMENWYVIQMDDNQIGAIDAENATPIVKEKNIPRVEQTPQVRQQPLQQQVQPERAQPQEQREPVQETPVPQATNLNKLSAQEQEMVNLVNGERTKNGLPALKVDLEVARVAEVKSQDMADNNYFSHNSPTYGSPFDMMKSFGVNYLHAGENLAGNSTVQRAHEALMNSSGHRQNILNPDFTYIGIGIRPSDKYGYLFTQMFISKPK